MLASTIYKSEGTDNEFFGLQQDQNDPPIEACPLNSLDMASFEESILSAEEQWKKQSSPIQPFFPYWETVLNCFKSSAIFNSSILVRTDFCSFLLQISLQDVDIPLQLHSFNIILTLMNLSPQAIDLFIQNNIIYYCYQWLSDKNNLKKEISCAILSQCLETENGFHELAKMEVIPKLLIIFDSYIDLPSNSNDTFPNQYLKSIAEIHLKLLNRADLLPSQIIIQISRLIFKALKKDRDAFYSTAIESTSLIVNCLGNDGLQFILDDDIIPQLQPFIMSPELIEMFAIIFQQRNRDLKNLVLKNTPFQEFIHLFLETTDNTIIHTLLSIFTNCLVLNIHLNWILEPAIIGRFGNIFDTCPYQVKEPAIRFFLTAAYVSSGQFLQTLLDLPVMIEAIQNIPSLSGKGLDLMLKCLNNLLMKIGRGDVQATDEFDTCVIDTLKILMNCSEGPEENINTSELAETIFQSNYPDQYYQQ